MTLAIVNSVACESMQWPEVTQNIFTALVVGVVLCTGIYFLL